MSHRAVLWGRWPSVAGYTSSSSRLCWIGCCFSISGQVQHITQPPLPAAADALSLNPTISTPTHFPREEPSVGKEFCNFANSAARARG